MVTRRQMVYIGVYLEPVQKRVKELEANKDYLDAIIKDGAEKASRLADRTLAKVQRKVGFPNRIR